jgi:hypothetical protein
VGLLAGGKRGIRPGVDIGGSIGCASVGMLGMFLETMASGVDVEEYKKEQAELEKIQRKVAKATKKFK